MPAYRQLPRPPPPAGSSRPDVLFRIPTPYNYRAFQVFFEKYPKLKEQYKDLPSKLVHGFPMGNLPEKGPHRTIVLENGRMRPNELEFVDKSLKEEVTAGRMDGPYSRNDIEKIFGGKFRCSPITVSEQDQEGTTEKKLRMCIDLSRKDYTGGSSPNDYSSMEDFPTSYDTSAIVAEWVRQSYLPPSFTLLPLRLFLTGKRSCS